MDGTLRPRRALVVVDFQKDFVDGALGFPGADELEPLIAAKVSEAEAAGDDVYFTLDDHGDDYLETQEGRNLPVRHCCTEEGRSPYGSLAAASERHPSFRKHSFGCLELADAVSGKGYTEIEICGLVTNICVISNAVILKAALPEARIVVDAGCVSSYDRDLHEKSLDVMAGMQISVINRD